MTDAGTDTVVSPTLRTTSNSIVSPGGTQAAPTGSRDADADRTKVASKKQVILFLAANPSGTDRLALDREARSIHAELKRSGHRDQFEFVTRWAAEPLDLLREVRELKPTVVHFSGHGSARTTGSAESTHGRDVDAPSAPSGGELHGLCFHGTAGDAQVVSPEAIAQTLGAVRASVKIVVLNACFTAPLADALLASVDCVVGMSGPIHDDAARSFAIGFYGGLGEHESVATAFEQGKAAINLEGLGDAERPQLKVRDGIDATQLVLAAVAPPLRRRIILAIGCTAVALSLVVGYMITRVPDTRQGSTVAPTPTPESHTSQIESVPAVFHEITNDASVTPSVAPSTCDLLRINDAIVRGSNPAVLDITIHNTGGQNVSVTRAKVDIVESRCRQAPLLPTGQYQLMLNSKTNEVAVSHVLRPDEVERIVIRMGTREYVGCEVKSNLFLKYNERCWAGPYSLKRFYAGGVSRGPGESVGPPNVPRDIPPRDI